MKVFRFSPDQLTMHAAWLKAERDEQLVIPCKALSDAKRLRFSLYNAVKPIKDGKADLPMVLAAVEACTISIQAEPLAVIIQLSSKSSMMQGVLEALGDDKALIADTPTMTGAELESMEKALKLLETPVEPGKKNPFYTREDR